eukprot:1330886-Pyramimonas_sp.AAC.1
MRSGLLFPSRGVDDETAWPVLGADVSKTDREGRHGRRDMGLPEQCVDACRRALAEVKDRVIFLRGGVDRLISTISAKSRF